MKNRKKIKLNNKKGSLEKHFAGNRKEKKMV